LVAIGYVTKANLAVRSTSCTMPLADFFGHEQALTFSLFPDYPGRLVNFLSLLWPALPLQHKDPCSLAHTPRDRLAMVG
jgi:hypothetical protein